MPINGHDVTRHRPAESTSRAWSYSSTVTWRMVRSVLSVDTGLTTSMGDTLPRGDIVDVIIYLNAFGAGEAEAAQLLASRFRCRLQAFDDGALSQLARKPRRSKSGFCKNSQAWYPLCSSFE